MGFKSYDNSLRYLSPMPSDFKRIARIITLTLAILTSSLFINCGKPQASLLSLPQKYAGAGTVRLDSYSMIDELGYILKIFNDSVDQDELNSLWKYSTPKIDSSNYSSSMPNRKNILKLFSALSQKGYTIFSTEPQNMETLFALSRKPIFVEFLSIEYNSKEDIAKNIEIKTAYDIPNTLSKELKLQYLKAIDKIDKIIRIKTSGNITVDASSLNSFSNQITISNNNKYTKLLAAFIITKLPEAEIRASISDWYKNLSYKFNEPEFLFY